MTRESAYICDAVRTPFGRYGGALAGTRTDDLAAVPLKSPDCAPSLHRLAPPR